MEAVLERSRSPERSSGGYRLQLNAVAAAGAGALLFVAARCMIRGEPFAPGDVFWLATGALPTIVTLVAQRLMATCRRRSDSMSLAIWLWPLSLLLFLIAHELLVSELVEAAVRDALNASAFQYLAYANIYIAPACVALFAIEMVRDEIDPAVWAVAFGSAMPFFAYVLFYF